MRANKIAAGCLNQQGVKDGPDPARVAPGGRIGGYRLGKQIGEGGFGRVFLAWQEKPVPQPVALKLIKAGVYTLEVVARFETERRALALLDHPNVTRVLEAGLTRSGRPYLVMELVRGVPITTYCDRHRLCTSDRLLLFTVVCHAVEHAHQKGIVHRDLKPANILVTQHDGKPLAKIIDFDVAKTLNRPSSENPSFAPFQQLIGTPSYMSPEQADLGNRALDARSDIYSLGVLLYELLTGSTPFDQKMLQRASPEQIRRVICYAAAPKPSERLRQLGRTIFGIAKRRRTDPGALVRRLRGDLDWIVMKCLEKNPSRRYQAATLLALDIYRYLRHEPVRVDRERTIDRKPCRQRLIKPRG